MSLIKNATAYIANLGDLTLLGNHLESIPHVPPLSTERRSSGFVPPFDNEDGEYVVKFPDGALFCMQIDEKMIPASAVKTEIQARVKEYLESTGRKHAGKAVKADIKQQVLQDLCIKAPIRTTHVNVFYHLPTRVMIVNATSSKITDLLVSAIVQAVGTVTIESIQFENARRNLATRLAAYLPDSPDTDGDGLAFEEFTPGGDVVLTDANDQKISFKLSDLSNSADAIRESLTHGFVVDSIRLECSGGDFKLATLASTPTLRGINVAENDDDTSEEEQWFQDAVWETTNLAQIIVDLRALFPSSNTSTEEGAEEAAVGSETD